MWEVVCAPTAENRACHSGECARCNALRVLHWQGMLHSRAHLIWRITGMGSCAVHSGGGGPLPLK